MAALETALRAAQSQTGGSSGTAAFSRPSCLTLDVPGSWICKLAEHEQHLLLGVSLLTCKVRKKSKGKDPRAELSSTGKRRVWAWLTWIEMKACFHRKLEMP